MNALIKKLISFLKSSPDDRVKAVQSVNKSISQFRESDEGKTEKNKDLIDLAEIVISDPPDPAEGMVTLKDLAPLLDIDDDSDFSTIKGTIMALKNPTAFVPRDEFEALSNKLAVKEAEELVQKALSDGKITPAQGDWALDEAKKDSAAFKVFLKNQPEVVPLSDRPGYEPPATSRSLITDEIQLSINKMLGIDEKTFKQYGPKIGTEEV